VTHLVLFRPHPTLTAEQRQGLADALLHALRDIPSVRRARVGARITHGRGYEALMRTDYPYIAMLEFDDAAGLMAYLAHPAHTALGNRFFESFEEALIYDFNVEDGEAGIAKVLGGPA